MDKSGKSEREGSEDRREVGMQEAMSGTMLGFMGGGETAVGGMPVGASIVASRISGFKNTSSIFTTVPYCISTAAELGFVSAARPPSSPQ